MHQSIESLGGGGGAGHAGILLRKKSINSTHPHYTGRDQFCGSMPHPWGMLNKISTFYFVKINHKNLSSYITNNKTFSSYKNKILDLEKTPFTLLFIKHLTSIIKHLQHHVTVKILLLCTHSPAPGSPPGEGP